MVMSLEEFDDAHGGVITNALNSYAERMRSEADDLLAAAYIPQGPPTEPKPGYISMRPTPAGMRQMAVVFADAAKQAENACKAWTAETEGPDEEDAELLGIDPDGTHHFRV
jgi:hypothetical protein